MLRSLPTENRPEEGCWLNEFIGELRELLLRGLRAGRGRNRRDDEERKQGYERQQSGGHGRCSPVRSGRAGVSSMAEGIIYNQRLYGRLGYGPRMRKGLMRGDGGR